MVLKNARAGLSANCATASFEGGTTVRWERSWVARNEKTVYYKWRNEWKGVSTLI